MGVSEDRDKVGTQALRQSFRGAPVRPPPGFEDVAAHRRHEASGLRVWFIQPLGILTQVSEQHRADLDMAKFLSGSVTDELLALREDPNDKLLFVHDWSAMTGYSKETRSEMTRWGVAMLPHAEEIVVHLGAQASSLVRMGVSVASGALGLAGIRLAVEPDLKNALVRRRVRARPR